MKLLKIAFIFVLLFTFIKVNAQTEIADTTDQEIFTMVEHAPEYPGGDVARLKFLSEKITYPKDASRSGIQGTVYIAFVVEKDGSISNVKVLRGIGGGCDEVAVNAVKSMPKWKPGFQRGKTVRAQFNMPISFVLDLSAGQKKKNK